MENRTIKVSFEGKDVELKTALIGGVMADKMEFPMGMYAGKIDIGEVGTAVMHVLRAAIKINVDQHDMSVSESEHFICFCLAEAARRERDKEEDISLDIHEEILKMVKEKL